VQKFWKSIKIWQSYREFKGGPFFETQCIRVARGSAGVGGATASAPITRIRSKFAQFAGLTLCCLTGGGLQNPPLCFSRIIFAFKIMLRAFTEMENAHFAENRITRVPLGHVWSVVEHIWQISANWSHLRSTVPTHTKCVQIYNFRHVLIENYFAM